MKLISKITGVTLLSSMLLTSAVLANEPQPLPISSPVINQNEGDIINEVKTNHEQFVGKITNINKHNDHMAIRVTDEKESIVFNIKDDLLVINQKTTKTEKVENLKKDMQISVVFDKNAPMTLSLPPITNAAQAIIINNTDSFIDVAHFDENLINEENTLKLNLNEESAIINLDKKKVSPEELKNKDLICLYKFTTRSIPAQTSPELVVLLENTPETEMIPLRDNAENYGYEVNWIGENSTVILKKGAHTVTLTIGSDIYGNNKSIVKLEKAPELKDGRTYIPKEMLDLLVK